MIGEYNSKKIAEAIIKLYSEKKTEDISKLVSKSVLAKENPSEKSAVENKPFDEYHSKYRTENTQNDNNFKSRVEEENYAKSRLDSRETEENHLKNRGFEENSNENFRRTREFYKNEQEDFNKKTSNSKENISMNQSRSFLVDREKSRLEENTRKNAEFNAKYEEILRQKQGKKEETNRENELKYENKGEDGAKYKEIIKKYIKKSSQGEKKGFVLDENNKINKYESLFLIGKNDDHKVKIN